MHLTFLTFCSSSIRNVMKRSTGKGVQNEKSLNKKLKSTETDSAKSSSASHGSSSSNTKIQDLNELFIKKRTEAADSVMQFDFKKDRVRILSKVKEIKENSNGILYWMSRDGRVQDNWAFLYAQKLAFKNEVPLHCCFCLVPKFLDATLRHYKFLLGGLTEVEKECQELNINFHLLLGCPSEKIPEFVKDNNIGGVVSDFSPLRVPTKWLSELEDKLPIEIGLCQVDAHNIVPVWHASDKQEYAARTIRNKINKKLDTFLTEFPPLIRHPYTWKESCKTTDWKLAYDSLEVDIKVDEVKDVKPGYKAACIELEKFCTQRLKNYNDKRNDPTLNALSNLSPWFHFGHISVQRCILQAKKYYSKYTNSVNAFCEEAIVRRELSDNFCFYNKNYDNFTGLTSWAQKTLNDHRKDKRQYLYSLEEIENSKTHDDLWNSAQIQLVKEGKMHGFLRMYWAKKILEWTESPEEALRNSIYLNDKYSLDGRDPNGYVGCMWSIGGIHDQGWKERPVFGKIRYMVYQGCQRKFDVKAYVARHNGKVYAKK